MTFHVFDPMTPLPSETPPTVTIRPSKQINLNPPALAHLGATNDVELLHDPERNLLALQPCRAATINSYSIKNINGLYVISTTRLLNFYGAKAPEVPEALPTFIENGLLCADFSQLLPNN